LLIIKDSWHSWFVAYGPYDAPKDETIVVCVMVEATNEWEMVGTLCIYNYFSRYFLEIKAIDEAIDALGFRYLVKPVGRQE